MAFKDDLRALLLTGGGTTFQLQLVSATGTVLARQTCTEVPQGTESFVFSMDTRWQCEAAGVVDRLRFTNSSLSTIVDSAPALVFTGGTEVKAGDVLTGPSQVTVARGNILQTLVPSTLLVTENIAPGSLIATFANLSPLATLTLVDDAGGRFVAEDGTLIAGATNINYEETQTLSVIVRQTVDAEMLDQTILFTVVDVAETVLAALTIQQNTLPEGTAEDFLVGIVQGDQGGALSLTDSAGGRFKLVNVNELRTGAVPTDYGVAQSHNITIRETLSGATNSPLDTVLNIVVSEVVNPPVNTVAPLLSFPREPARVGDTVTCSTGTWTGEFLNFAFQWRRGGVNIGGATSSGYTITSADELTELDCQVTASNTAASVAEASSNKLGVLRLLTLEVPATGATSINPDLTVMPGAGTADVTATPGADWRYTA